MFENCVVSHKSFGCGNIVSFNPDNIVVSFNGVEKILSTILSFEKGFLSTTNEELLNCVRCLIDTNSAKKKETEELKNERYKRFEDSFMYCRERNTKVNKVKDCTSSKERKTLENPNTFIMETSSEFDDNLYKVFRNESRIGDVPFEDVHDMFFCIGWIARNVSRIRAEITYDRVNDFNDVFGISSDRNVINRSDDVSTAQFRVFFDEFDNVPDSLEMVSFDTSSFHRGMMSISRSKFIFRLIHDYGFRFGETQDVATILEKVKTTGYEEDFNRGYYK